MRTLLISGILSLFATFTKADEIQVSRFSTEGLANWQTKSFLRRTEYTLVKEGMRAVVKAVSNNAASGLVNKIHFTPQKYRYLRWSWKISHTVTGGNETAKAGDDYAARVYVIFPGRFFWQTKAINYIWANRLAKGSSIPNPYSANAMMIAVESGESAAGEWISEQRDLVADYRLLFGAEPPEAEAIAIMTDTDNTGAKAEAWYGEISLSTEDK